MMTAFNLQNIPPQRRGRAWVDALNEFFYAYDADVPDDFRIGKLTGAQVGSLSIASAACDAITVRRERSQISHDGVDGYFLLLPVNRALSFSQRGRTTPVTRDEFSLVSASLPYEYMQNDIAGLDIAIIPGQLLRSVAPSIDDLLAKPFGKKPIDRLFIQQAKTLCREVTSFDIEAQEVASRHMVELLALILDGADAQSHATPIRQVHKRQIVKLIERHHCNPGFGLEDVVRATGLSPRYIQEILAGGGSTFTQMLRLRRLQSAKILLNARRGNRRSVIDVAYAAGFADLSYFYRSFKQEYGHAPNDEVP